MENAVVKITKKLLYFDAFSWKMEVFGKTLMPQRIMEQKRTGQTAPSSLKRARVGLETGVYLLSWCFQADWFWQSKWHFWSCFRFEWWFFFEQVLPKAWPPNIQHHSDGEGDVRDLRDGAEQTWWLWHWCQSWVQRGGNAPAVPGFLWRRSAGVKERREGGAVQGNYN